MSAHDQPADPIGGNAAFHRLLDMAVAEGTLDKPSLVFATDGEAEDMALGADAYHDERLGTLTTALSSLAGATMAALLPGQKPLIEGIAYCVGSAPRVSRIVGDGFQKGDLLDAADLAAGALIRARNMTPGPLNAGPDDGLRRPTGRTASALDHTDLGLGMVVKVRDGVVPKPPPTPFEVEASAEPRVLREMAKSYGMANPLLGAGLTVLDVLTDQHFWKALEQPKKRRMGYRTADGNVVEWTA